MINFAHGDGDPCPLISPFFCFPIFFFIFIFLIFLLCLGMYNIVVGGGCGHGRENVNQKVNNF